MLRVFIPFKLWNSVSVTFANFRQSIFTQYYFLIAEVNTNFKLQENCKSRAKNWIRAIVQWAGLLPIFQYIIDFNKTLLNNRSIRSKIRTFSLTVLTGLDFSNSIEVK